MAAVELTPEVLKIRPDAAELVNRRARHYGVVSRGLRGVAVQISPPFVVTEEQIGRIADGIAAAIGDVMASLEALPAIPTAPTVRG